MKRLYVRCNGGHYFAATGNGCPFDAWTMEGVAVVSAKFAESERGVDIDLETLRPLASKELFKRLLIIDFGDDDAVFEALAPERYLHKGREVLAHEVGLELY